MSSKTKSDLIYSIFALDAYNRGNGAGISGLGTGVSDRIGKYSFVQDISQANCNYGDSLLISE